MTIQTLVAALKQNKDELIKKMNIKTNTIVTNQCDEDGRYEFEIGDNHVLWIDSNSRGVGLNRNTSLKEASADIVLFSDEDIVYEDDYGEKIIEAFSAHPDADMLLFNVEVEEERRTYFIEKEYKVGLLNSGRFPSYSFACKREALLKRGISYSLLFGGGAKYSNGEDSLFILDCIKRGMRVIALPIIIGKEIPRKSTWFNGYDEKFFKDRGVLYVFLYGIFALPLSIRFLHKHGDKMLTKMSFFEALALMRSGIREGRNIKK